MIAQRAVVLSEAPGQARRLLRWTLPLSVLAHGAAAAAGIWLAGTPPQPLPAVVTVEVISAPGAPLSSSTRGQAPVSQDAPDSVPAAAPEAPAEVPPEEQAATPAPSRAPPMETELEASAAETVAEIAEAKAEAPSPPAHNDVLAPESKAMALSAVPAPPPSKPEAPPRRQTDEPAPETPAASDPPEPGDPTSVEPGHMARSDPAAEAGDHGAAVPSAGASTPPSYALGSGGNPIPEYPWPARRAGWEGRVVVEVAVRPDGAVTDVDLAQSSGHDVLDEAALETIRRWRFEPAKRGGVPVAGSVEVPITFRLVDDR